MFCLSHAGMGINTKFKWCYQDCNKLNDFTSIQNQTHQCKNLLYYHSLIISKLNEPPHGKTNNLHMRNQRRRSASLISAFVFATRIVQFLLYLTPKFQASSHFLCLYRPFCVGPVQKPQCWFSHEAAPILRPSSLCL